MSLKNKLKNLLLILIYLVRHPRRFYNALSKRGQKWALRGLILLLVILIAIPASLWYQSKKAQAAWWNDSWQYRIAIPVTNNTTEQSNVYISTTVNTSDTAKFQADCGDIRFTNLHGVQLPYYIVSGCGTASTVIHVNFEVFPAGAQTIYMYYGNPSAPNGFAAADFANLASSYAVGSLGTEEIGPGPIAYWKFDEGQGGTAYNSTSQTGINGTLGTSPADPTWKPESECVAGKCLSFDGSNDYVDVASSSAVNSTSFTLSYWINWTGGSGGAYWRISSKTSDVFETAAVSNGSLYIYTPTGGWTDTGYDLSVSKWVNLSYTYNGTTLNIYADGKNIYSANRTIILSGAWRFGNRQNGGAEGAKMILDEPKIYPYARTEAQVQQDYNSGKAGNSSAEGANVTVGESPKWMTDGLIGHWKMDETSGTVVADASGNGNNGTLAYAQETGTGEAESTTTTVVDADNAALSTTNDAYNNMILRISPVCGSIPDGTERTITDYDGAGKYFTVAALPAEADSCAFEVRHQTGGKFGNGLEFSSGEGGYVQLGDPASGIFDFGANSFSFSGWIKIKNVSYAFMSKKSWSAGLGFTIGPTNNRTPVIHILDSGGHSASTNASYVLNSDQWYHFVGVCDRSQQKLFTYVNGQIYGTKSDISNIGSISNNINLRIGRLYETSYYFNGSTDDIRIYNRALSPDEARALAEWGPGPVGHWKMDENVSGNGQTIKDYSGNGNNGTTDDGANNTGMDCTKQGKYGGGCQFDGTDDYAAASDSASLSAQAKISFGAWVNPASSVATKAILAKDNSYRLVTDGSGNPICQTNDGTGWQTGATSSAALSLDSWQYVSCSYDQSNIKVFINGIQTGSSALATMVADNANAAEIGKDSGGSYGYWNGLLDDVRIYNYARSPKQIVEDMNAGHPAPGSPVGSALIQLKFDEGQGATANNSGNGGSAKNGTMTPQGGGQTQTYEMWSSGGKFNRAADLDGTDDYISIPDFSY